MELETFVKSVLVGLVKGVKDANAEMGGSESTFLLLPSTRSGEDARSIQFDVSVLASEKSGSSGGAGLSIQVVRAGIDRNATSAVEMANRVKFSVAIKSYTG